MSERIEAALAETEELNAFVQKYGELIRAMVELRKVAAINNVVITGVSLPIYWFNQYPDLKKDLRDLGFEEKLIGVPFEEAGASDNNDCATGGNDAGL